MATIKNQKYAIVSTQEDVSIVKKMGVKESAIVNVANYGQLIGQMRAGDILCVASISSFATGVEDFRSKIFYLINKGIEFQSAYERYLNFSLTKNITPVTAHTINVLAERELDFMGMVWNSRLNMESKQTLVRRIGQEYLACLRVMFESNGILKRGC